jgi:hypothetical protein
MDSPRGIRSTDPSYVFFNGKLILSSPPAASPAPILSYFSIVHLVSSNCLYQTIRDPRRRRVPIPYLASRDNRLRVINSAQFPANFENVHPEYLSCVRCVGPIDRCRFSKLLTSEWTVDAGNACIHRTSVAPPDAHISQASDAVTVVRLNTREDVAELL